MTVQQKPAAVTTGPVIGCAQDLSSPAGRPDIRVPFREIALHPSADEPPFRIYDTSGPYTDPAARIDLEAGLPPLARRLARRAAASTASQPRAVKPEDNGGVGRRQAGAAVPGRPQPSRRHGRRGR